MTSLPDRDLALLHTKFIVPVVIGQILRGDEALDDTAEYLLNTVIADLTPDSALLCIALCAQPLCARYPAMPAACMLRAEADRIVEEYGSLWLAHDRKNTAIDQALVRQTLSYVPEDLEAMAHLLDATLAELSRPDGERARVCDLLGLQAHEKMEQAETQALKLKASRGARHFPIRADSNVVPFRMRE
jgi:hypothetical protein